MTIAKMGQIMVKPRLGQHEASIFFVVSLGFHSEKHIVELSCDSISFSLCIISWIIVRTTPAYITQCHVKGHRLHLKFFWRFQLVMWCRNRALHSGLPSPPPILLLHDGPGLPSRSLSRDWNVLGRHFFHTCQIFLMVRSRRKEKDSSIVRTAQC